MMPDNYPPNPSKYKHPFRAIKNKVIPKTNFTVLFTLIFPIKLSYKS